MYALAPEAMDVCVSSEADVVLITEAKDLGGATVVREVGRRVVTDMFFDLEAADSRPGPNTYLPTEGIGFSRQVGLNGLVRAKLFKRVATDVAAALKNYDMWADNGIAAAMKIDISEPPSEVHEINVLVHGEAGASRPEELTAKIFKLGEPLYDAQAEVAISNLLALFTKVPPEALKSTAIVIPADPAVFTERIATLGDFTFMIGQRLIFGADWRREANLPLLDWLASRLYEKGTAEDGNLVMSQPPIVRPPKYWGMPQLRRIEVSLR